MDRPIIDPMEQMRDFDFVMGFHDVLVGLGAFAQDTMSGLATTVIGGLVANQTPAASLSVQISAGRIYQAAASDPLGVGSIPADSTVICQQGLAPAQTITFTAPSSGQSQWNLIQAQFSQLDAVRTNDPNGGIVPFYNVANPTQPTTQSVNTVRQGLCVLQVISGSAATTGTEVPPTPTAGWVPLYLVDIAGGQTQITTSQILKAGPGVGTNVSGSYPFAPFLGGLMAAHHSGNAGQAPKVNLVSEVQGVLPYVNMSPVRTLLSSALTLYVNGSTGNDNNLGTTAGAPFLTIQAAINALYSRYDFNGFGCTVNVANGTYGSGTPTNGFTANFQGPPLGIGGNFINLVGNVAAPANCICFGTNANAINISGCYVTVQGFTITASGSTNSFVGNSGYGVQINSGGYLSINNCTFGTCGNTHIHSGAGGAACVIGAGMTFTGSTPTPIVADNGFIWMPGQSINVTGLSCTIFITAADNGIIQASSDTFVGTATGARYSVATGGILLTNGGGASYFPGNSAGTPSSVPGPGPSGGYYQ